MYMYVCMYVCIIMFNQIVEAGAQWLMRQSEYLYKLTPANPIILTSHDLNISDSFLQCLAQQFNELTLHSPPATVSVFLMSLFSNKCNLK